MSYHTDIVQAALANAYFRKVLFTTELTQLVLMAVGPGEDIGEEIHEHDQVLVFVAGRGDYLLDDARGQVGPGSVVVVPAGTRHNFINASDEPLKLYTVYAPPEHADGTIHHTKEEADLAEAEHHGHAAAPPAARKPPIAAPRGLTVGSLLGK